MMKSMTTRTTGDKAVMLVTGAARGIGAAIARQAVADGYRVVVNFAASEAAAAALVAELGDDAISIRADVADEAAVEAMFATIDQRFGRVDVLVNNAGIAGGYGALDTVTAPMMHRLFAVNVTGAFVCAREAARRMRTDLGGTGGSIINLSSKAAVLGGPNEWVHYAATKGAIDTMTTGLAKELAAVGVRVNAVRPGLIESDFHDIAPPGRVDRMAPIIPMLRAGTGAEVAEAVLWLASPAASYVTGAFLDVTGGR
jgi:NAD(P)-dependent dehydrogenase (short-subunit alcohol dehydrogenase family)